MKIDILKEKEIVMFVINDSDKYIMNFENLVTLAKLIVENREDKLDLEGEESLGLYKETITDLYDSIVQDSGFLELIDSDNKETDEFRIE